MVDVAVMRLPHAQDLPLPAYQSEDAAGVDLIAAVEAPLTLLPLGRALVPTGLAMALPSGYEAQVRPRSGLAAKHGVTVLNSPGTVDADYRGEVKVILINLSDTPFTIVQGRTYRPDGDRAGEPRPFCRNRGTRCHGPRRWRLRIDRTFLKERANYSLNQHIFGIIF